MLHNHHHAPSIAKYHHRVPSRNTNLFIKVIRYLLYFTKLKYDASNNFLLIYLLCYKYLNILQDLWNLAKSFVY